MLYVSGEESKAQIKLRADRLEANTPDLFLLTELCLENILEELHKKIIAFLSLILYKLYIQIKSLQQQEASLRCVRLLLNLCVLARLIISVLLS